MRTWLGIAVLVVAGALLKRHTDRVVRSVNARPPAGTMVQLPHGPVHLLEAHHDAACSTVLIHGSDGVVGDWPLCGMYDLVARQHHVLAYDRPGHGHTPVPPGESVDVNLNVRMLRELIEARGVQRPVLVGHSYGATVALAYALRYPADVKGLLLLSPTAFPSRSLTNPLAYLMRVPGLRQLITRVLLLPLGLAVMYTDGRRAFAPAPLPRSWRDMMLAFSRRPSQVEALAEENSSISHELRNLTVQYGQLAVPCTIIAGVFDHLTPYDAHARPLAEVLPGTRLVTLDAGHEVHWTHLGAVMLELHALSGAPKPD